MTETKLHLEDWLDDLCVRFIINLPREELESVERICFQVEEAQWFYEDFIRPLDPALPSLSLKAFAMRIFQHCPLMSEWSEYHHAAAFSEFLAYKTRVPVRGAILLNEAMDKVVLVKGWKKSASWSFPRGKINKEEKDLDCAVREVLEETGYDLKAAGLVKDEKHMKHIEITMREQHMKLYVFRGVPMDTAFAPQTRKEISRIEWVNLTDLPTVKKNKQAQNDAVNANKFYMVAPFLNPLKKWITQQRKIDAKNNALMSTAYTEGETSMDEGFVSANNGFTPLQAHTQPALHSDLPEVTPTQDVSSHLKRLLNIGAPVTPPSITTQATDSSKSNALLSLLRSGANGTPIPTSNVPQQNLQPAISQMPPLLDQVLNPTGHHAMPDVRNQISPPSQTQDQQHFNRLLSSLVNPSQPTAVHPPTQAQQPPMENLSHPQRDQTFNAPLQPTLAPYQRTGDPLFAQQAGAAQTPGQIVPPASKLPPPKLTSHSLALLNVFKGNASAQSQAGGVSAVESPSTQKTLTPQDQLLALLKSPAAGTRATPAVELAAQPVQLAPKQILQRPASLSKTTELPGRINVENNQVDALTSATVSGPLRTPDFDKTPTSKRTPRAHGKHQPPPSASPIKILSRPSSARRDVSTPSAQTSASASPSFDGRLKSAGTPKSFQPQILRRSEKLDLNSILPARQSPTNELPQELSDIPVRPKPVVTHENKIMQPNYDRRTSQSVAQKETLLSLFGKSPSTKASLLAAAMEHPVASSPFNDATPSPSLSGVEALAPAGAISSIDSASDHGSRTSGAQRLKSPDNKAFLLGFLQNVAEGKK
ncbi:mRNA decapping complex subunit 2 [Talaromyces pinophilus]|nr:mRNA decapping complex subunit 2 [Talaromyces pinophilus]